MSEVSRERGRNMIEDAYREVEDAIRKAFAPYAEGGGPGAKAPVWNPRVDVSETDTAYVVKADLPGVDPNDVEITLHEGVLTIRGERREEREEKEKNYHVMERTVGSFHRQVPLPGGVDADRVTASSSHGVITINVPKKPGLQPKKISLSSAG